MFTQYWYTFDDIMKKVEPSKQKQVPDKKKQQEVITT
jgi:hypothetical protein